MGAANTAKAAHKQGEEWSPQVEVQSTMTTPRIRLVGWIIGLIGGIVVFLAGGRLINGYFDAVKTGTDWPNAELWRDGPFLIAGVLSTVVGHLLWQRN